MNLTTSKAVIILTNIETTNSSPSFSDFISTLLSLYQKVICYILVDFCNSFSYLFLTGHRHVRVLRKEIYILSSYYTLISKIALCPQYNRSVVLSAKYRFTENPQNDYEVKFAYATCPIVENSRLPKDEQCEEYKYLDCFHSNCELLKDFPALWDARKKL